MDTIRKAEALLRDAEEKLRDHLTVAVSGGDYNAVVQLAAWARAVNEMLNGRTRVGGTSAPKPGTAIIKGPQERKAAPSSKPSSRPTYPIFFRDGERLLRVAWSKKDRKEYEHRMLRGVLESLISAVVVKGANGRIFTMDSLLPLFDADGAAIPAYQAYVALGLLRHASLIDQHGRSGYSVPKPSKLTSSVDTLWQNLPAR